MHTRIWKRGFVPPPSLKILNLLNSHSKFLEIGITNKIIYWNPPPPAKKVFVILFFRIRANTSYNFFNFRKKEMQSPRSVNHFNQWHNYLTLHIYVLIYLVIEIISLIVKWQCPRGLIH